MYQLPGTPPPPRPRTLFQSFPVIVPLSDGGPLRTERARRRSCALLGFRHHVQGFAAETAATVQVPPPELIAGPATHQRKLDIPQSANLVLF